jgi:chorismate--pyruvate lyase
MRRACGEAFNVEVLRQSWGGVWRDEARRLDLRRGRVAWVREVLLCNGAEPWIYARTIMPERVLRGHFRRLRHLGRQPLGRILFGRHPVSRGAIEVADLREGDGLYTRAAELVAVPSLLWARRSIFRVGGLSMLVTEVFLPHLVRGEAGRGVGAFGED